MRAKRLRLNLKGQKVLGGYFRTEMLHFCHPESCYLAGSRKEVMRKQSRAMIIHSFHTTAPSIWSFSETESFPFMLKSSWVRFLSR